MTRSQQNQQQQRKRLACRVNEHSHHPSGATQAGTSESVNTKQSVGRTRLSSRTASLPQDASLGDSASGSEGKMQEESSAEDEDVNKGERTTGTAGSDLQAVLEASGKSQNGKEVELEIEGDAPTENESDLKSDGFSGKNTPRRFDNQGGDDIVEVQHFTESGIVSASETATAAQETAESLVNIQDTFITIETKDGQSSKKIPFSQFLKKMVVDKQSGNFTLNLEQFLDVSKGLVGDSNPCPQHESPSKTEVDKGDRSVPTSNSETEGSGTQPQARSCAKRKHSCAESVVRNSDGTLSKVGMSSRASTDPPQQVVSKSPGKIKTLNNFVPQGPRRSSRIPAKNKRFANDYVNSLTLGKTPSSSSSSLLSSSTSTSSWNTQLMTLALAAETHKNKPHDVTMKENASQLENDDEKKQKDAIESDMPSQGDSSPMELDPPERSCTPVHDSFHTSSNVASRKIPNITTLDMSGFCDAKISSASSEHRETKVDAANKGDNALCTPVTDANQGKTVTVLSLIGNSSEKSTVNSEREHNLLEHVADCQESPISPTALNHKAAKTSKKNPPVYPLVKKTLHEAMTAAKDTAKNSLHVSTPNQQEGSSCEAMSSPNIYYTIMEPKMEAEGHGLLVHKSAEKIDFRVTQLLNVPSEKGQTASKTYPQDRLFSCEKCDLVFTSTSSWLQHNQSVHNHTLEGLEDQGSRSAPEVYQCGFCEQKFPYKFMLDNHIKRKRHSELKHFRCTLCRENFSTHKAREEHWMTAHPARSCGLCGKQFNNIVMLRRHIGNNCHGARFRKQAENLKGEATNEAMVLSSHETGNKHNKAEKSQTQKLLGKHISTFNAGAETVQAEKKENVKEATESQETSIDLNQVHRTGSQKLKCRVCTASFFTSSGLWKHMMEKHRQFYPQGFKDRLLERMDKNQALLSNTENALVQKSSAGNKSKYFVVMNPKIADHKNRLSVSSDEKKFTFKCRDEQMDEEFSMLESNSAEIPNWKQTVLDCIQCKQSFLTASEYRDHRSKVHGECFEVERLLGAFQCTLCSDTFPCQFMLDKHLKKHVGKKLLPCTLCGLEFHKIQERRQHWKSVHPGIGCPNCGKMYASIKYLQKHISLNCQDHFPPSQKFLEFQKQQHNDFEMGEDYKRVEKKILRCHLCPKICSSVHGWRRHMTDAHEDVGFSKLSNTCIICGELVYGYKALEKHLLDKHAEDSGLPVDEENSLVEEAVKKSDTDIKEYKAVGRNSSEITQDEFGNYQCPSCSKTHPDLRAIKTHMKTHVDMELECSHCGKTFKNPALLKQHIQRHRKEAVYTCETCNKSFLTLLKLNKHCKVHHAKGNFTCELCGASFALNEYLQKHRKCHTDIRPHGCSICAKTFRTKAELRVHFLIHTRETPYVCEYCGRGFSQRGNYRTHLAQHTGVKPYQCERCELSFALKCHLTRHLATHDQLIQYRCLWCDKECTQRKHMQMHVQRVHQEDFIQHEEAMKLDTPVPIPESKAKLYNRRPAKASKIRRQYRTKAERCEPTVTDHPEMLSDSVAQMMVGLPTKSEPMDVMTTSTVGESIIHVVGGMEEQAMVSCVVPEEIAIAVSQQTSSEATGMGNFEILVNGGSREDHQAYTKSDLPIDGAASAADLLLQENMQLVVGENNEISIIIKNEDNLHADLGEPHGFEPTEVHPSLQEAIVALANQTVEIKEEPVGISLAIGDLDKVDPGDDGQILNFVTVTETD